MKNDISELTNTLKHTVDDISAAILDVSVLNNVDKDMSKFGNYIQNGIIAEFEQNLRDNFNYEEADIEFISSMLLGGYYFMRKFIGESYKDDEGNIIPLPDTPEVRDALKTGEFEYEGRTYYTTYLPVLNLVNFESINELFRGNSHIIGIRVIIFNGSTLDKCFMDCNSLMQISIEAKEESLVDFNAVFYGCYNLNHIELKNIKILTLSQFGDYNSISLEDFERLDLSECTTIGQLVYNYDRPILVIKNINAPKCMRAGSMLNYYAHHLTPHGIGDITLGVGCAIDTGTLNAKSWPNLTDIGMVSGICTSVSVGGSVLSPHGVHNVLLSFATDVRTYGHSSMNNAKTITLDATAISNYKQSEYYTTDLEEIVDVKDNLTDENTIQLEEATYDEQSTIQRINAYLSERNRKAELYDAYYDSTNKRRYYVTGIVSGSVSSVAMCAYRIVGDYAVMDSGTIFDLLAKRKWTYE